MRSRSGDTHNSTGDASPDQETGGRIRLNSVDIANINALSDRELIVWSGAL